MIGDDVLERFAFEILHHDEGTTGVFAYVTDGADVGVVEGGGGFSFAAETFERVRIAGQNFREEISARRDDRGACLRLCRPRPCRHRPVVPGCGSERWSAR